MCTTGIYDDHEVKNNWSGYELQGADETATSVGRNKAFEPANQAWQEYVGSANPPAIEQGRNYYSFRCVHALCRSHGRC
jgi:alkaline phosphatase D